MFDDISYNSLDTGIDVGTVDIGSVDIESLGLVGGSGCSAAATHHSDDCAAYPSEEAIDISQNRFECLFDLVQEKAALC